VHIFFFQKETVDPSFMTCERKKNGIEKKEGRNERKALPQHNKTKFNLHTYLR